MASVFYFIAVGVCIVDGLVGLIVNILLLRALLKSARTDIYRVPICASAIQGGVLCIIVVLFAPCHIFRDGTFIIPFFNPLSPLLPRALCDAVLVVAVVLATMMWTLIPAIGILQLFALSTLRMSKEKRIICSFIFPIACAINIAIFSLGLLPTPKFLEWQSKSTRQLYKLELDFPLVLYGSTAKHYAMNSGRSLITALIGIIIVPYTASYGLFVTLVLLIRRKLSQIGVAQSVRTRNMQRALYIMQVLQGFLPLAILSVPLGLLTIGTLLQLNMDFITLVFTVFIWACPIVQAFVQLRFVLQSSTKSPEPTKTTELTKMSANTRRT